MYPPDGPQYAGIAAICRSYHPTRIDHAIYPWNMYYSMMYEGYTANIVHLGWTYSEQWTTTGDPVRCAMNCRFGYLLLGCAASFFRRTLPWGREFEISPAAPNETDWITIRFLGEQAIPPPYPTLRLLRGCVTKGHASQQRVANRKET